MRSIKIPTEQPARTVANYTIGFLLLNTVFNSEDAQSAGSGVLVSVGKVFGVLTAAHVLHALPRSNDIGVVTFPSASNRQQRLTIKMQDTEQVRVGEPLWSENGPDIGFLRLPQGSVEALKMSNSFRNLLIASDNMRAGRNLPNSHFDAVAGVLADRTRTVPWQSPNQVLKVFEARFQTGTTSPLPDHGGFDRCLFHPDPTGDVPTPASFEGTSGGGLWRIYWQSGTEDTLMFPEVRLTGIAYFQSGAVNNVRTLTCHAQESIYSRLLSAIQQKWREAG